MSLKCGFVRRCLRKESEQATQYRKKINLQLLSENLLKSEQGVHENMPEDRSEKKRAANRSHFFKIAKYLMISTNKYLQISFFLFISQKIKVY